MSAKRTLYNKLDDCYNAVDKKYENFLFFSQDHQYKKNGEVKVCKKYFYVPINDDDTIIGIVNNDNHLYELVPANIPVHPYFDCEMTDISFDTYQRRIDTFLSFVSPIFENEFGVVPVWVIYNSSTPKKLSYHLTASNCYFENVKTHKEFINWLWKQMASCPDVGLLSYQFTNTLGAVETRYIFDKAPYGANQNFRFYNQSKIGKNNPFILQKKPTTEEDDAIDLNDIFIRVFPEKLEECQKLDASKFCVADGKIKFSQTLFTNTPSSTDAPFEESNMTETNIDKHYEFINDLLHYSCLSSVHMSYDDRIKIGMAFRSLFANDYDKGLHLYLKFRTPTMSHSKEHYVTKFAGFNNKSNCGMNLIVYQSRLVNASLTNVIMNEYYPEKNTPTFTENMDTDLGLAKLVCFHLKSCSVCVDVRKDIFYQFTREKLYELTNSEHIRGQLEQIFTKYFKPRKDLLLKIDDTDLDEDQKMQLRTSKETISKIEAKFQSTGNRNNIIREVQSILSKDRMTFEKALDVKLDVVPIASGKIFNVLTKELKDRTIEDKWTFECPVRYFETIPEDLNEELERYFNAVFCGRKDTLQVFIDIVKSAICGKPLRFIFFLIGEGRNGKSLLLKLISSVFPKFMDVISNDVIIEKKNRSNITTEYEKLENVRIGYITELKEEQQLDNTMVKKITGGDGVDVRGLQKTNRTIRPTTTLFVATNQMPNIDVDKATHDRLGCFPFNNRFDIDTEIETRMLRPEMLSCVFSYIMNNGVVRSSFEFTDEMLVKRDEVIADNETDYLKDFILENCEECEVDRGKGNKSPTGVIKVNDFRQKYNTWLSVHKYPAENSKSSNVFVRKLKKQGLTTESNHGSCILGLKWIEETEGNH